MKNYKFSKLWLIIYIFLTIFQPPIFSVTLIYVLGVLTIIYFVVKNKGRIRLGVFQRSGMMEFYSGFLFIGIYLVIITVLNSFIINYSMNFFNDRIKCFNHLLILTGFELVNIWYILEKIEEHHYSKKEVLQMITIAGVLQGICSVLAYCIPSIRQFFLRYNTFLLESEYHYERRGYGFSAILLDVFGYGMGLLAGVTLLNSNIKKRYKVVSIAIMLFSVLVNARTGIAVFGIAVVIYLFRVKKIKNILYKAMFGLGALFIMYKYAIPVFIDWFGASDNVTFQWVGNAIKQMYQLISTERSISDVSFLSDFKHLPTNFLEFIFGSGHSAYGLKLQLGFHSDVGYINLLWTYGIVGTVFIFYILVRIFIKAFKSAENLEEKYIVILVVVSYFVVLLKGRLIGYNPGTVVTYLILFYLINEKSIEKNKEGQYDERS